MMSLMWVPEAQRSGSWPDGLPLNQACTADANLIMVLSISFVSAMLAHYIAN